MIGSPPDWSRLKSAFAEVADLPAPQRDRALERMARADARLAERLSLLLAADDQAEHRLSRFEMLSEEVAAAPSAADEPTDVLGLVGSTIAHFRVLDVLGAGGMGVAYRAEDLRLGRTVALKFLKPRLALDAEASSRFMHEARSASALDHRNVCTLLEIGQTEHGLFLAMPAYPGETLRERLAREHHLPPAAAVDIARQVLDGLAAAHAAGITHRDLKPGNLVITIDGTLKILDFGLARGRDSALLSDGGRGGTIAYMSPEQLTGDPSDERSDLWSVGVVLHEMLTGARPFGAGGDLSTVHSILHDRPPAPSSIDPSIPRELDIIVARLLAEDPALRYGSARDVMAALDELYIGTAPGIPAATRLSRRRVVAPVLLVVFMAAAVVPLARRVLTREPATVVEVASVAVLPFLDTSPSRDQAHLGEGVAEEIRNALIAVPGLSVPARASSFRFAGSTEGPAEIGRRLGVSAVLDGSVHRVDGRVRIMARLLDVQSGHNLWSQTFDARFRDIFDVQDEIARTVAAALKVMMAPAADSAAPSPSPNIVAYELYLRGLFHWNRRTTQDVRLAIDFFTQAAQHDSMFARPYAGLALSYAVLPLFDPSASHFLALTHDMAARALALDSTLAEAHAARGYAYHWQWRWTEAERELQRAIALNGSYSTAHQWYGEHLVKMGRGREAEAEMRRAIQLDPHSVVAQNDLGIILYLDRRFDQAIAQLELVRRTDPAFAITLLLLHRIHLATGNVEAAADAGRRWAELTGTVDPAELVVLAMAVRDTARRAAAREILARRERSPAPQWPDIAMYYGLIDDRAGAVRALERALAARSPMLSNLGVAAWLDPLRSDPDVRRIIAALELPRGRDDP